ncbi:hypothetical protein [uncultured Corynebacterium sp.]|uniref:hypothetical protein n=1 Tax=uncultured Corynebacterium sp. TaxID=159447 RepID=UPI0025FFA93F|nr:hypothetical protein [uncultured Corynebacterium sp.]
MFPTTSTDHTTAIDHDSETATGRTRQGIRRTALAATASLGLLFGAATTATAAPAAPAPTEAECQHVDDPARLEAAIAAAKYRGDIADGPDWAPNKAYEFMPGECGEAFAQPISARGGDPSAPTALLLYHPDSGEFVRTAEIPGFAAEGPAWGTMTSGMKYIEQSAPDVITVWWENDAGEHATVEYRWTGQTYELAYMEGSQ